MEYGLIGKKLAHSFSKSIHTKLNKEPYELVEVAEDALDAFMTERNFKAINVTMPYKESVIKHLECVDSRALEIGAVNTVVNRDGVLHGYNTDFLGMSKMLQRFNIDPKGRSVAILGSGGTSKTAAAVAKHLGANRIFKVSRNLSDKDCTSSSEEVSLIDYSELYAKHSDIEIIINTTPVGMYPNAFNAPVNLAAFKNLCGVADCVYNPLSTSLVCQAKELNINACGGLYMLVAQAIYASSIFHDTEYGDEVFESIYRELLLEKENIALIGMPSCGKTTVGKGLAQALGLEFIDVDELIKKDAGMEISEIFARNGEKYFRQLETEAIKGISIRSGCVIATGGGAVLNGENIKNLRLNGKIVFIDRPLELLVCTSDRPLSSNVDDLKKRFCEREPLYRSYADVIIDGSGSVENTINRIIKLLKRK